MWHALAKKRQEKERGRGRERRANLENKLNKEEKEGLLIGNLLGRVMDILEGELGKKKMKEQGVGVLDCMMWWDGRRVKMGEDKYGSCKLVGTEGDMKLRIVGFYFILFNMCIEPYGLWHSHCFITLNTQRKHTR
jgi:hypothetical protein